MDEQTKKLLKECSSGCKMAINSLNQVRDFVKDEKLHQLLDHMIRNIRSWKKKLEVRLKNPEKKKWIRTRQLPCFPDLQRM